MIRELEALAGYTTFRIGGAAHWFAAPATAAALRECREWARRRSIRTLLLGGGSNLLVDDGAIDALVVRPRQDSAANVVGGLARIESDPVDPALVTAGASAPLARLLGWAAVRGWSGLEDWAAIPGTVGGAAAVNAGGARGLAELAWSVEVLDGDGTIRALRPGDGGWKPVYRDGGFSDGDAWVVRAAFRLRADDPAAIRRRMAEAARAKAAKQPLGAASAGCVFRNPPGGPPAGKLLEEAGLKGERIGGARVSEKHANFIVNEGNATAADVLALMDRMRERTFSRLGVDLRTEIRLWR